VTAILLDIPPQDLPGERDRVRPATRATGEPLCDDGAGRFFDRDAAHAGERGEQRSLSRTRATGDDDMRHR
jgi:hypothetical protein